MSLLSGAAYGCDRTACSAVRLTYDGWVAVATDRQGTLHVYHDWAVAEQAGVLPYANHYCGCGHAVQAVSDALGLAVQEAKSAGRTGDQNPGTI